jgi:hypothetical protein
MWPPASGRRIKLDRICSVSFFQSSWSLKWANPFFYGSPVVVEVKGTVTKPQDEGEYSYTCWKSIIWWIGMNRPRSRVRIRWIWKSMPLRLWDMRIRDELAVIVPVKPMLLSQRS